MWVYYTFVLPFQELVLHWTTLNHKSLFRLVFLESLSNEMDYFDKLHRIICVNNGGNALLGTTFISVLQVWFVQITCFWLFFIH